MSTRQYLIDASTKHQVFLQRFAGGESKRAQIALGRIRRDIKARLYSEPTEFQQQRLNALLTEIDAIYAAGFGNISSDIKYSAVEHAESEAAFSAKLYTKGTEANFIIPGESALIMAVTGSKMAAPTGRGAITIDDALAQYGKKKAAQIKQLIMDGVVLGDTTPTIAKKVGELMQNQQRRQLDALVRTITNHTSSIARQAVYDANSDLLKGYQWVATLDGRTTLICASRDGVVYQVGAGPMPPAHWNCRSTTVPVVHDEFNLGAKMTGERASRGAEGSGTVSANVTYGGWLKKQPPEFQNEALGVERAKLFRSGKLSIDKFVDPTGRVYTLTELERMNPFVFAEA